MSGNPNLHNIDGVERAKNARKRAKDIYISTNSHREVQDAMDILRLTYQGERGEPMTGLRLSQVSSAGKSAMLMDYVKRTLAAHQSKTGCYNPYLVLYINLLTVTTPKMLCQAILRALGDPNRCASRTVRKRPTPVACRTRLDHAWQ